jgi:hypothetical protein
LIFKAGLLSNLDRITDFSVTKGDRIEQDLDGDASSIELTNLLPSLLLENS